MSTLPPMPGDRAERLRWTHEPALDDLGDHRRLHQLIPTSSPKFDARQEKRSTRALDSLVQLLYRDRTGPWQARTARFTP